MPVTPEELERIASKFAVAIRGMYLFEPDYTNWLLIDLAAEYGRRRLLNWLGFSSKRIRDVVGHLPAPNRHFSPKGLLSAATYEQLPTS
jgi:hypothetical protein